jgi:hypothetical protein
MKCNDFFLFFFYYFLKLKSLLTTIQNKEMTNVYVVITCSLITDQYEIREIQYKRGITQTIKMFNSINNPSIEKIQLVIVENNHINNTKTFLEDFGLPVIYTRNNHIENAVSKGYKELKDVNNVIDSLQLKDDDVVIKITGRYFIHDDSAFIEVLKTIDLKNYDAVLRYGGYNIPEVILEKHYSCHTSLIAMKVIVIRTIEYPPDFRPIEWKWADATQVIPYEKLYILDKYLGVSCNVGGDTNLTQI